MDKKRIYEKLGAVWFQKVVFKVEKIKYSFIDKFFPDIYSWYSKYCDKKANKLCLKVDDEQEKKQIRYNYNIKKLVFKRELVEKKNINYHLRPENASKFNKYLLWNKKIHKNGIIRNVIYLVGYGIAMALTSGAVFGFLSAFFAYNLLSLAINFECVNLQNYNLCRLEEKKDVLARIEARKKEDNRNKYANIGQVIYEQMNDSIDVPKQQAVVDAISNLEDLKRLRELAIVIKKQREHDEEKDLKSKVNKRKIKSMN